MAQQVGCYGSLSGRVPMALWQACKLDILTRKLRVKKTQTSREKTPKLKMKTQVFGISEECLKVPTEFKLEGSET